MLEPGAHPKSGNYACHCRCDEDAVHSSPYDDTDAPTGKKIASLLQDENKSTNPELYCGIGMSLHDSASHSVTSKRSTNHWWEDPGGFGSRGRATASLSCGRDHQLDSPTTSDLAFEGRTISAFHRDNDACAVTQSNSVTLLKAQATGCAKRPRDSSDDEVGNALNCLKLESPMLIKGRKAYFEKTFAVDKERTNRWTDANGKMVIPSDVFNAILPSADEVGLQWRISELRVALRASESARLESEQETEALRKYLAEVEAAATTLQSRVQELEHRITLSTKDDNKELEQLRTKIVMEASKEARNQSAQAAKAVAAAREATMELDKVKRHSFSVINAQEEEAERLRMEAAECRTLYQARAGQLQEMKEEIVRLEQNMKVSSASTSEALKASQEEFYALQKSLEAAKMECHDKQKQLEDVLEDFETHSKALQAAEDRVKELERENSNLTSHREWLEQQIADLQRQGVAATAADYDQELSNVRTTLEAEKQHLLSELAMLRHGNQNLQVELVEWKEKFYSLSQQMSASGVPQQASRNIIDSYQQCTSGSLPSSNFGAPSIPIADPPDFQSTKRQTHQDFDSYGYSKNTGDGVDGHECLTPNMETEKSSSLCSCHKDSSKQNFVFDGHCVSQGRDNRKHHGLQQRSRNKSNIESCSSLKDDLLAAAHREILRLKEINQCLMDARRGPHGRMWYGNDHVDKENFFHT